MTKFEEHLMCNDEFEFFVDNKKYEVVWNIMNSKLVRSIYRIENSKDILMSSFDNNEELLNNAVIENQLLKEILGKIIVL